MRQGYVLGRMHTLKKITDAQYKEAIKEATIYRIHEDDLKAGYFTEWVRQKVVETVGEKSFLIDGYKIKTTLDWELQKIAEDQIQRGIKEIDKRQGYKGHSLIWTMKSLKNLKKRREEIFLRISHHILLSTKIMKKFMSLILMKKLTIKCEKSNATWKWLLGMKTLFLG